MANPQNFITHIRNLIAKDDFPRAIQELSALLKDSPHLDEAIQQSARYNDIMRQIRLGIVDFQTATITKNQIRMGLLALLSEIEERENEPNIKAEVERFSIKIEKNVLNNSTITAGGYVNIGDTIHTESKTSRNLRLFLYIFVPLLAIGFAYFYSYNQKLKEPIPLTVFLQDKTPNPNIPFEGAKVSLKYGDETKTETFTKEYTFRGISPRFRTEGEKVSIHAEANGFFPLDTSFLLTENNITLPLRRNNDLGKVFGFITQDNGKALAGVTVSIQDISVQTDATGRFDLLIPFEKQLPKQRITAVKNGVVCKDETTPIIPNVPIRWNWDCKL